MIELFIETLKEIESICIIHSRFPFLRVDEFVTNLMKSYQYIWNNWIDQTRSRSRVKQCKTINSLARYPPTCANHNHSKWDHPELTRMHSSRIRAACSLPDEGGLPDRHPQTETSPGQRPFPRQRPPVRTPPGQRSLGQTPQTEIPLVDRQTHVKTLPSQTLFAGGNEYILLFDFCWLVRKKWYGLSLSLYFLKLILQFTPKTLMYLLNLWSFISNDGFSSFNVFTTVTHDFFLFKLS